MSTLMIPMAQGVKLTGRSYKGKLRKNTKKGHTSHAPVRERAAARAAPTGENSGERGAGFPTPH